MNERAFFSVFRNRDLLIYITSFHTTSFRAFFYNNRAHLIPQQEPRLLPFISSHIDDDCGYIVKNNDIRFIKYIRAKYPKYYHNLISRLMIDKVGFGMKCSSLPWWRNFNVLALTAHNNCNAIMELIKIENDKFRINDSSFPETYTFGFVHCINTALEVNNEEFVKLLYDLDSSKFRNLDIQGFYAAKNGNLGLLQWLHTNCAISFDRVDRFAAEIDRKDIISWYIANVGPSTNNLLSYAADNNHFELAKWIYANKIGDLGYPRFGRIDKNIAENGNLEFLIWIRSIYDKKFDAYVIERAISGGHFHVVKYIVEHEPEALQPENLTNAAKYNQFDILKWIYALRPDFRPINILYFAVYSKNIEILNFLMNTGKFSYDIDNAYFESLKEGREEMRDILREHATINKPEIEDDGGEDITLTNWREYEVIKFKENNRHIL